jgi:NADH dehydrogenase FAD-containing subunit
LKTLPMALTLLVDGVHSLSALRTLEIMANILILGGGFGGVVAAEYLGKQVGEKHQITLISRSRKFIFYPDLVRVAFGKCKPDEISFDVREAMLDRRIRFIEGEVALVDPYRRRIIMAHGEVEGEIPYDYLIFAPGRRLATEQIAGFFEHANHLLTPAAALEFGEVLKGFHEGRAVIGQCPGARLPVPVYETAFALARLVKESKQNKPVQITIVSPDPGDFQFDDLKIAPFLRAALEVHHIEYLPGFPIRRVTSTAVISGAGHAMDYDLLMLIPPFRGPGAVTGVGITDDEGYVRVDRTMRVEGVERMYAIGDCVNFSGPKLGHMAVLQAQVAAANVLLELEGLEAITAYDHEMMLVIDEGGKETIYLHKHLWDVGPAKVKQGRFWSWAKRTHERYWLDRHA